VVNSRTKRKKICTCN